MMTNKEIEEHLRKQGEMLAEMMAQLQAMQAEAAKAAEPAKPFVRQPMEKYDWTSNMSMPRNAIEAMVAAVGDKMIRSIVEDHKSPAFHSLQAPAQKTGGTGWVSPKPLGPPPGIEQVDQLCDQQDAIDKRALAQRLAKPGSE